MLKGGAVTSGTSADDASMTSLILRRFWQQRGARAGVLFFAVIVIIATYAPWLVGNVALLWFDDDGLRVPILSALFNQRQTPTIYDFAFGLTGVLAPLLAFGWLIARRFLPAIARVKYFCLAWVVILLACFLPVWPANDNWQPLWRSRPPVTETVENAAAASWAVFPFVERSPFLTSDPLLAPGARDSQGRIHLLGTDNRGFDCLARAVYGSRITLTVGMVATVLSLVIGIVVGALSGFFGGRVDLLLQRVVEIMMTFPTFVFLLVIVAMLGRDILLIMAVIGLTGWAGVARLVRGEFMAQTSREYVLAGRALGYSSGRLMFRHILPNAATPLLINAAFAIAGAIMVESSLAFLGLGDPLAPSWGAQLDVGRRNLHYIWLVWIPGLLIFLVVFALNLIGDALREAVDAKSERG